MDAIVVQLLDDCELAAKGRPDILIFLRAIRLRLAANEWKPEPPLVRLFNSGLMPADDIIAGDTIVWAGERWTVDRVRRYEGGGGPRVAIFPGPGQREDLDVVATSELWVERPIDQPLDPRDTLNNPAFQ